MRRSSAFTYAAERSLGLSNDFQDAIYQDQVCNLQGATRNYIYDGGMRVWCMELDPVDERYLLVGSSKSVINLYDLQSLDDNDAADPNGTNANVCHYDTGHRLPANSSIVAQRIRRQQQLIVSASTQQALQFGISSIDWYPVDGGLFVTSSFDGLVRVWDSMVFSVEVEFAFNCKVFAAKFSPISTTHSLIAAVTANREVRLCDMATDSSIHSLLGHQDEIWSLAWSRSNEFQLTTGSRNGEVRMWDIRRSGATACLLCLNHEGEADVPGRSSLYTNIKKLPSTSLVTASRANGSTQRKRRRIDGPGSKERTDPNMAATVSLARGHSAGVNALAYTPDGRFLMSSGHDHRLRAWDATSGEHLFVNYEGIQSSHIARNVQMAIVQEGDAQRGTILFHPNGKDGELTSYKVHHGDGQGTGAQPLTRFTAHYKPIVSCVYRKSRRELFTGAGDGLIMKWVPKPVSFGSHETTSTSAIPATDQDDWSDDDSDEEAASLGATDSGVFVPPILRQEF